MASTYVKSAVGIASASLGSGWSPGDYAIVFAFRNGGSTPPTLPSGWTNIASDVSNSRAFRCGYRVLQSGDTTTGFWSGATSVIVLIYRSVLGAGAVRGDFYADTVVGPTNPLSLQSVSGGSRVICFLGHSLGNLYNNLDVAVPDGTTRRALVEDASDSAAAYETDLLTADYSMPAVQWADFAALGYVVLVELRGPVNRVLTGSILASGVLLAAFNLNRLLLTGSIAAAGALARKNSKVLAGAVTAAGAIARKARKALSGAVTATAALAKKTSKVLAGVVTAAGAVLWAYLPAGAVYQVLVTGSINVAGAIVRKTSKAFAGAVTATAALAKKTSKVLAGAVTAAAALAKKTSKAFAGAVTATAALAKKTSKAFTGAVAAAGAIVRKTSKVFAGAVAAAGAIVRKTSKAFSGAVTAAAALAKKTSKTFAGAVTAVGAMLWAYLPAGAVYQVLVTGSINVAGSLSASFLGFVAALGDWVARRRRRRR